MSVSQLDAESIRDFAGAAINYSKISKSGTKFLYLPGFLGSRVPSPAVDLKQYFAP